MSSTTSPHHDADPQPQKLEGAVKAVNFTPRQLNIVWGNDPRYWKIPATTNSSGDAELLQVCWLEVSGNVPIQPTDGDKYRISFKVSLKSDAFGWNNCPVYVMAKFGKKGKYAWKKILLQSYGSDPMIIPTEVLEIQFKDTNEPIIYFGLYEVWSGKWKGGLLLHSATVEKQPKN